MFSSSNMALIPRTDTGKLSSHTARDDVVGRQDSEMDALSGTSHIGIGFRVEGESYSSGMSWPNGSGSFSLERSITGPTSHAGIAGAEAVTERSRPMADVTKEGHRVSASDDGMNPPSSKQDAAEVESHHSYVVDDLDRSHSKVDVASLSHGVVGP